MNKSPFKLGTSESPYSGGWPSDDSPSKHGSREKDKTYTVIHSLDYIRSSSLRRTHSALKSLY